MKTIVKAVISFHETGVHICVCHGGWSHAASSLTACAYFFILMHAGAFYDLPHTQACRLFVAYEGVYAKSIRKIYDYHLRFKSCRFEFRVLIILSCFKYMCIRHERIQI